ncbi:MAG: ribosome hibernation-promoting factor, HPF/YfiA family [Alphaproteobacteria bacterium]
MNNIIVTGRHIDIGKSLNNFVVDSLESLLNDYVGDVPEAHVTMGKNHHLFTTDILVHIRRNLSVHCHGEDTDAYKSASKALDKLEKRIKRYKSRLRHLQRHRDDSEFIPAQMYTIKSSYEDNQEEKNDTPIVIAEKQGEISTLSVSDAVMKMDIMGVPILMFRNAANDLLNVVYKKEDGHIGWINPSDNAK